MTTYRVFSALLILLTFGLIGIDLRSRSLKVGTIVRSCWPDAKRLAGAIARPKNSNGGWAARDSLWLLLLCVAVMAATGFLQPLFLGRRMSGYLLVVHVAASPLFSVCVIAAGFLEANRNLISRDEWRALSPVGKKPNNPRLSHVEAYGKLCFWSILFLTFPALLSIVASMFTVSGTDMQELLLGIHRYAVLLIVLSAILYAYFGALRRIEGAGVTEEAEGC